MQSSDKTVNVPVMAMKPGHCDVLKFRFFVHVCVLETLQYANRVFCFRAAVPLVRC